MPTPELSANSLPVSPVGFLSRYWLIVALGLGLFLAATFWFRSAFVDTGYAPEQYIAFSHQLHAGKHRIDCTYCHADAARGKHAGIPPMSVCLGCHKNGQVANDRPEVAKLLEVAEKGSYVDGGIVREGGVVHWNRVHKLPDHVYFTHAQHVAAGVACQTCHGPVEEMARVRQFSDLTMGWCLECHRRDNYVSDPSRGDAAHAVGVANYHMQVGRMEPDPVVVFHQQRVKGADHGHEGHAADVQHADSSPAPQRYRARLAELMAAYPDLPRWRVADLPSSHRAYLEEIAGVPASAIDAKALLGTYMNAPTQCSTCHQ